MTPDANLPFFAAVSYTLQTDFPAEYPLPPVGSRWVLIVATLTNRSPDTIAVEAGQIILLDADDNRYLPEEPDQFASPPLVGTTIAGNDSFLGVARFAVPEEVAALKLLWCVDETCTRLVEATVP